MLACPEQKSKSYPPWYVTTFNEKQRKIRQLITSSMMKTALSRELFKRALA